MTYHSQSAVAFGQLMNNLTRSATIGASVPELLDIVKDHFEANIVLLSIADETNNITLHANSAFGPVRFDGDAATFHRSSVIRALIDQYHCVEVTDSRNAKEQNDCKLWILRDRKLARYSNEETALGGVIASHLSSALSLATRLRHTAMDNALFAGAMDRMNIGFILADTTGRLLRMTDHARHILDARDGLHLHFRKLHATNAADDRSLQSLIRATAEGEVSEHEGGLALTGRSGLKTLGVMVRTVDPALCPEGQRLVAIYLRDRESALELDSDTVRRLFDLTPAEAAVTRQLAAGLSLEETAIELEISRNTARAHLRSIFSKNGISRQTELVRMVLNSAAAIGGTAHHAA
ncbi:helix-turn-helix transcriptional regulator [Thalassorhabdomicrobium marinisediminis]|uniref:helix-turn-helix transcriptional regulator n=1 Tax=Thalassorhabdomicrobium marinisediminis TaxID=2170577 RepID=UPI002490E1E5|nr:helix-turn-helix transcriptional regulator [Thalassorhabdomicrobium marinisediminis]